MTVGERGCMVTIFEGNNCVTMSKETFNLIETAYSMFKSGEIEECEKHVIKGRNRTKVNVKLVNGDLFFEV